MLHMKYYLKKFVHHNIQLRYITESKTKLYLYFLFGKNAISASSLVCLALGALGWSSPAKTSLVSREAYWAKNKKLRNF